MKSTRRSHLTYLDRCRIQAMYEQGHQQKSIAEAVGKHPSTVSRELSRNITVRHSAWNGSIYRADHATRYAAERQQNKPRRQTFTPEVRQFVEDKLYCKWSPEQIAGYAKVNQLFLISHERIYQFVLADKKAGGQLYLNLRQGRKKYRRRYGSGKRPSPIKNRVSIDNRPEIINNKERLGDWEIDTVIGKGRRQSIITVAERVSKKYVFRKVESMKPAQVAQETVRLLKPYQSFVLSATADNGLEFRAHETISSELGCEFYFAHPYSSWERGLNEHCNGLLRQYFPKGTDFSDLTEEQLHFVEQEINNRPRKALNYRTPNEVFDELALQASHQVQNRYELH